MCRRVFVDRLVVITVWPSLIMKEGKLHCKYNISCDKIALKKIMTKEQNINSTIDRLPTCFHLVDERSGRKSKSQKNIYLLSVTALIAIPASYCYTPIIFT